MLHIHVCSFTFCGWSENGCVTLVINSEAKPIYFIEKFFPILALKFYEIGWSIFIFLKCSQDIRILKEWIEIN